MSRQLSVLAAALAAILSVNMASAQILFSDGMNVGTNWTITQTADASSLFGFDYSTLGIPPAPRGSDTIGLKLEANNSAPASVDHIIARNANALYTGQYTVRVDLWLNWALVGGTVGTGTTEFAGVSIGHDGTTQNTNGATLIFDGDGDSANNDYRLYKNAALQTPASGQYATGTVATSNDNNDPAYAAAFPTVDVATAVPTQGQTGSTPAGAAGFQWITLNVEVDVNAVGPSGANPANLGFARFSLRSATSQNAITVGTIDNSAAATPVVNMSGAFGLIVSDLFNSVTTNVAFDFTVFDNVKVFAGLLPLPAANALGDFNNDGDVDSADFLAWQRGESPNFGSDQDFADWKMNWPTPFLSVAAGASVPEPASASLLLGAVTILLRRQRLV